MASPGTRCNYIPIPPALAGRSSRTIYDSGLNLSTSPFSLQTIISYESCFPFLAALISPETDKDVHTPKVVRHRKVSVPPLAGRPAPNAAAAVHFSMAASSLKSCSFLETDRTPVASFHSLSKTQIPEGVKVTALESTFQCHFHNDDDVSYPLRFFALSFSCGARADGWSLWHLTSSSLK